MEPRRGRAAHAGQHGDQPGDPLAGGTLRRPAGGPGRAARHGPSDVAGPAARPAASGQFLVPVPQQPPGPGDDNPPAAAAVLCWIPACAGMTIKEVRSQKLEVRKIEIAASDYGFGAMTREEIATVAVGSLAMT